MHRQPLLNLLAQHTPTDADEQIMTSATIDFVQQYPNCFERSLLIGESTGTPWSGTPEQPGHITGSAWVVSIDRRRILLIHHCKLDRWLQPGGHADGDTNVAAVALREAQEETGLTSLRLVSNEDELPPIFDVDIHAIPARGDVPEHVHYDIRFLVEADPNESFGMSDEIENIQWFMPKDVNSYTDSESILRMMRKIM